MNALFTTRIFRVTRFFTRTYCTRACTESAELTFARRMLPMLMAILSFALFAPTANADIDVRVGGVGCTFSTIQQAIDNANPANGITNILIARNGNYSAQAININGKNVRLIGGYVDCNQTVRDNVLTILSGLGGSARSILNISGSTGVVALYNLRLTGGDESQTVVVGDSDVYGGAIDITGGPHALIYLENTHLLSNGAGIGGALSVRGNPANTNATFVWLSYNTLINNNAALNSGGGVYCSDATLHFKAGTASIFDNIAGTNAVAGNGGGIYANDCKVRVAASPKFLAGHAIDRNYAFGNGGGIYAFGSGTRVDIYNVDPINPSKIIGNTAERNGGAMNIEQGAKVYVWDGIIEGNRAYGGGGAVALYDDGQLDRSLFYMIQDIDSPELGSIASPPQGSVDSLDFAFQCSQPQNCSLLQGNLARNASSINQDGSVFRISSDSEGASSAVLLGARMTGNTGWNAVKAISFNGDTSKSSFVANGSLIDSNTNSTVLLDGGANTLMQVVGSTIANNTIPALHVMNADVRCRGSDNIGTDFFIFQSSISHQPSKSIVGSTPENGCLRHVLGSVLQFVPIADQATYEVGDPLFTNAAGGEYTLKASSPALDYAPNASSFRFTRDARLRNVDLAFNSNEHGPLDLGAYEMAVSDFPQANLQVTNNGSGAGTVVPGATREYNFLLFNAGPGDSLSTRVTSTHSANLSGCAWTCSVFGSGTCPASSGTGPINHEAMLPSGAVLLYSTSCNVANNASGTISSVFAAISDNAVDPNIADNTLTITDTVQQGTDLALTIFDGVTNVFPGGSVTYGITVRNNGNVNSGNVVVTDTFPTGLTCTWTCTGDFSGTCTASGSGNIADIANLPAGTPASRGEVTYVAVCTVAPSAQGSLVNTATVTANPSVPDFNTSNNTATDTNNVGPRIDLIASISSLNGSTAPSTATVTFIGRVFNDGAQISLARAAFEGDGIFSLIPGGNCSWTCSASNGSSCTSSGFGVALDEQLSLAAFGQATYTQTCVMPGNIVGTFTGRLGASLRVGSDANPANNVASANVQIQPLSDLAVSMSDGISVVSAGQQVLYSLSFSNNGPQNIDSFNARTQVPAQCTSYNWTCERPGIGSCPTAAGSGAINVVHASVISGNQLVYSIRCTLAASASGRLIHSATYANSTSFDAVASNNSATDDNEILSIDMLFKNGFENP